MQPIGKQYGLYGKYYFTKFILKPLIDICIIFIYNNYMNIESKYLTKS